ncbi:hypothetical protein JQS43_16495 [Natronosporangium hydrolyticum]|uniref:Rho termination factor N-terminal domain-containing protein n=1 Tax=Natronosporangium hydrolyticum TaxID=2811111 RepID=A0A895YAE1_9ACTN|nr:hypothetical protein [Natronosporangium hydrolyticum]QSB13222.1 hypothetical protein JQS43_16495 [Natronosporangium hydrolyticum]
MAESAELSHQVLLRVADFLRKLPADQLTELAAGEAKLEVVPKGGRRAAATTRPARPAPVTAEQIRAELTTLADPVAGRRWLLDQRLTVAQLVTAARELGVAVRAKPRKDEVLDQIVQSVIGRRLDFQALSRPGS